MIKRIVAFVLSGVLATTLAHAASSGVHLAYTMTPDLQDLPSLQRGWRTYIDYCIGCHSMEYQRYERTADDLQVPHDIVVDQLVFTGQKIGQHMNNAIPADAAKEWFGAPPPDLTLVARVRGVDWLYSYLMTFYVDESRPFGVNNEVFENVAMPHVLAELQGVQRKACVDVPDTTEEGWERRDPLTGEPVLVNRCGERVVDEGSGLLTEEEYDQTVRDLVNFLYYVGEPSRLDRYQTGVYVLLFLVVLLVFTRLLGREFTRSHH